ncbi:sugar ABC transporter ATP-binding protein [Pelotomaculum propionicicum]|uniref:sugar ABC transporter ATP-binding protein n=1 Tax=Pelotomaculum propionicicum TaxID=258475 RepID=UPI003B7E9AB3
MDHQDPDAVAAAYPDAVALKLQDISKIYPGTVALHKVNIDVKKGEVHGIIGKNGAGKSTLVEIIAGIITPTGGRISLGGKSYDSLSRIDARKKKIAFVPQEPQLILDFTVAENLFISDYVRVGKLINWPELYAKAEQVVKKAGLNMDVRVKAGDLPVSEQQLLLILKACYIEESEIIILDEASASLSQKDEELLYGIIQERKREGCTILFISHRADELLKVCDRVTVLRDGRSIITKECADLDKDKLSALIVGEEFNGDTGQPARQINAKSDTVLTVENLTRLGVYHKINFELKKGEILGLAGLRGSGRTEIFKGIIGIDHPDEGHIYIKGKKRRFASPAEALREGIVYLPEDREKEGLVKILSVRENLILNSLNNVRKGLFISKKKETEAVANLIKELDIKVASPEQEVSQLSGGNKQKVVVGKIAAARPHVFLLDEPTKGVDISAKQSILKIVKNNLSKDAGIIITSPGLEDLIDICDRILIIYKGGITGEFLRGELKENDLYMAIQGGAQDKCS